MHRRLTDYFTGMACKVLSTVETGNSHRHHQHEFNGVSSMRAILGSERKVFKTRFMFLGDREDDIALDEGSMTWYDAREAHPSRSEYRLYFNTDFIPDHAEPGDIMIMGLRPDQSILVIVCSDASPILNQLLATFEIDNIGNRFAIRRENDIRMLDVEPVKQLVLSELGIEAELPTTAVCLLDHMHDRFGENFPPTRDFSGFARETLPETVSLEDPDTALLAWLNHEESLFRTFEGFLVGRRLDEGFIGEDRVDRFVEYSLSILNRRKARAGNALENHMEYLLTRLGIPFERGARTEGRSKPDFLFPGASAYHDAAFPAQKLTMLGAKTTAKDRWRQILAEADRICPKHLLTLQSGISVHQLQEMAAHHVIPVMPRDILQSYAPDLQQGIMTVADFIQLVRTRQG